MEWVETTGKTVDEAKETALDQLGVHEDDAEVEVLEEPRVGLFGRLRGEARVRARVRPTRPRPKAERGRDRRKRRSDGPRRSDEGSLPSADRSETRPAGDRPEGRAPSSRRRRSRGGSGSSTRTSANGGEGGSSGSSGNGGSRGSSGAGREVGTSRTRSAAQSVRQTDEEGTDMSNDATVEEQAAIMRTFLEGLVDAFDLEATYEEDRVDEDTIELKVVGDNLGLLIGPKGQTLQAIQELARTVVQRQASGTHHGRVRIDIGGYRERRREALERFAQQVASDVLASGVAKALEPMHPADRKVVHDTVNNIDGVETTSEGEEPRRRVVIVPVASSS